MEFIKSNILLIGLALGSGFMLLLPLLKRGAGGVPNLSPAESVTLINRSDALVLDVRDDAEFAGGHIADAIHIPLAALATRLGELKKYQNKPILVNCQRGMRAAKACDILRGAEFTQVHNLQGGLTAWIEAKLPVVTQASGNKSATKVTASKSNVRKKVPKESVIEAEFVEVAPKKSAENEVV